MTPQKARRVRKFTPGVRTAFIELLALGYSPTRAAREVGVSRQAAYKQRAADEVFAEAWQEALEQQADLYEDALCRSAIDQKNIGGIIFGLKNLRPTKWKDRHEVEQRSVSLTIETVTPPEVLAEIRRQLLEDTATASLPELPPGPSPE